MTRTISIFLLAIATIGIAETWGSPANKRTVELIEEPIGGFVLYRVNPLNRAIEYLLLKKTDEDDWSPPKGNLDEPESEIDTAVRETREETGYIVGDYTPYIQYHIYFEYITKDDELKMVSLWPAKLTNLDKEIVLSPENEEYKWLQYGEASATIKHQYADGLLQADSIIRAIETPK